MSFNLENADSCFGPINGNDTVASIGSQFGTGWTVLLKDDVGTLNDGTGLFNGVAFSLDPVSGKDGSWTLHWTDNNTTKLPLSLDLAAVLKASNNYDGYLFEDLIFADAPASGTGTWDINFLNNGGQVPNLSHFSLYARDNGPVPPSGGLVTGSIPEPESFGLMGLGLLSLVAARRRIAK